MQTPISHTRELSRFDASTLRAYDEPVRRYFTHAIAEGTVLEPRMRLQMVGRIKLGLWLPFRAAQDCDGSSFLWRAQVPERFHVLTVTDSYAAGRGSIEGRLLRGAVRLFHSDDDNITRSAAGRAAIEGILAPVGLLPSPTRTWRAASDDAITLEMVVGSERPVLHLNIDNDGGVRSVDLRRWGDVGQKTFGYLPFGGDVLAEKRFGDFTLPAELRVGWWHGTSRFSPFFEAKILQAVPDELRRPVGDDHDRTVSADGARSPRDPR